MIRRLLATREDWGPAVARLALGVVILPHGLQMTVGAFEGSGFSGGMHHFTVELGFPAFLGGLAIVAESFGALGLIVGLLSRVAAFGIACVMAVAAVTVHLEVGFFMNWFGRLPAGAEGFEYHLLALGLALIVMIEGSGAFSIDRMLVHGTDRRPTPHETEPHT